MTGRPTAQMITEFRSRKFDETLVKNPPSSPSSLPLMSVRLSSTREGTVPEVTNFHTFKVLETGLGSADVVSLAEARDKARNARKLVQGGQNPIEAKRQAAIVEAGRPTFGAVADALVAAKESEWRKREAQGAVAHDAH